MNSAGSLDTDPVTRPVSMKIFFVMVPWESVTRPVFRAVPSHWRRSGRVIVSRVPRSGMSGYQPPVRPDRRPQGSGVPPHVAHRASDLAPHIQGPPLAQPRP